MCVSVRVCMCGGVGVARVASALNLDSTV
jgi:hypothetical protein